MPGARRFELRSRRALPGGEACDDGWVLRWHGTAVMGVVNVTPDSFSDGGRYIDHDAAIEHGLELRGQGALVVDVGGESTRPGARVVDTDVELARVVPVVAALSAAGVLVSVDTRKATVAAAAIDAGAHLVNDISGLRDPAMVAVCAATGTPAVVMHMQGTPEVMQRSPTYDDVVADVVGYLEDTAASALAAGVPSVLIDPGIGFGKTVEHNLALLRAAPFGSAHPVLVGVSRKKLVEWLAGEARPDRRDPGSLAAHLFVAQRGVAMVRAHDVASHVQALAMDAAVRDRGALPPR